MAICLAGVIAVTGKRNLPNLECSVDDTLGVWAYGDCPALVSLVMGRIFCKLGLHVWRTLNGTPLAGKGCYCLNCWEVRKP